MPPPSTPSVLVAVVTASAISAAQVVGLEREAAELCDGLLLARVARDLLLGAGPLRDVAGDDEHGLDGVVLAAHGDRLDGERQPLAEEVEATALALQARRGTSSSESSSTSSGTIAVQLGHQAAPEQRPRRTTAGA